MMPSRREFFRTVSGKGPLRRPPWTGADFTEQCTRCSACLDACPEHILFKGDGGFPEIHFEHEGCTFCQACVEVCEAPVFDLQRQAFPWRAQVEPHCLAQAGIHCQACQDACEPRAITFKPELGRPPRPAIQSDLCTGCGACQTQCPNDAISLQTMLKPEVQDESCTAYRQSDNSYKTGSAY